MIIEKGDFGFQLKGQNPFIVTMHHIDNFPKGNGELEPITPKELDETTYGDFNHADEWRMYYGRKVPGFPAHPHRGFETITIVSKGYVDHTDGLGSEGRYGNGDVQWMTAGSGLQHAEMFPLINTEEENTLELFQIWLSLDYMDRMVDPKYKMLWSEDIPVIEKIDDENKQTKITLIAGVLENYKAVSPTKSSYAYKDESKLSIQILELEAGSKYTIPNVSETLNRSIYLVSGEVLKIEDSMILKNEYAFLTGDENKIQNIGENTIKLLLLEAEPIKGPIVAYGNYVMNSMEEIKQAYEDFNETEFGGWPYKTKEIYHKPNDERFEQHNGEERKYPNKK